MAKYKVGDYIEQIEKPNGIIKTVAEAMGVSRSAVYGMADRHPTVKQALEDARANMIDDAESMLHKLIMNGDRGAITFLLRTLGKDRGYVERSETIYREELDVRKLSDEELEAIALGEVE